jgi:hypothetical protein
MARDNNHGWVQRHRVASFFVLAYAVSWLAWLPAALATGKISTSTLPDCPVWSGCGRARRHLVFGRVGSRLGPQHRPLVRGPTVVRRCGRATDRVGRGGGCDRTLLTVQDIALLVALAILVGATRGRLGYDAAPQSDLEDIEFWAETDEK